MFVRITDDPDRPVSREDSDDSGRFHVEVVGLDTARLRAAVEEHGLGRTPDADHVRTHGKSA
ncbi:hypothetical protein [Streptomyces aurantiogriseus]|uniref:Uncharacterized protein n=1 Tax=Streptomyces aurantiogriseus TaxID=66870 RepID=A0A918C6C1_9ACTN|nr:hypothetical protein [Streptomyces aurantiogriseus]GGR09070.1 hypothetical protein GCM10010251_25980 [Streptomyces aurantiogriseus]